MRRFRFVAPVFALSLVLTACPAGGDGDGDGGPGAAGTPAPGESPGAGGEGAIEVTSLWGGAEGEAFQAVIDAFQEANPGITVEYTSVRQDYNTVLNNRLEQGDPPDVAIIPGIGFLRSFAADDLLIPLSEFGIDDAFLSEAYAESVAETGQSVGTVEDTAYAIMVKLNSKATVWYRPDAFEENGWETAATWDELLTLTEDIRGAGETPWAIAAGDSWTLTDWFETVYLKQAGPDAYDTLFSAEGNWTDQTVKDAVNAMLEIITEENVAGGIEGALATPFVDGIGLVYSDSPSAQLFYEGGFVGGIAIGQVNTNLVPIETIDFFDFPNFEGGEEGAITIGGDVMAAFTTDPGVAEFMQYLASPEGGSVWAAEGTIVSPMADVDPGVYPNELAAKEAEQVANASVARFDGSDLLPAGTDLGAVLQTIIQDPGGMDGALEAFQGEVDAAWEEAGG
jgi:alpha-glucoside transport system substrate-binding protein